MYLGLRQMEWLFLTCHNYWIVCRLVKDDRHPFLAYSPKISINDSSQPFRAFLGAILSVLNGVEIEPSTFNPNIQLDTITEDIDTTEPPVTRFHTHPDNAEPELMVCPFVGSYLCMAGSSTLRLLPRPPGHLSPSKYGFISGPCRTTRLLFRCLIRMGNNACV